MPRSSGLPSSRDLPRAMLDAAHAMLQGEGIASLKLRAIARRAGVSATAGDPHFGNLAGLLSELAADGFAGLGKAMHSAGSDAQGRGRAYMRFALTHPALFNLMFRSDALDWSRPRLKETSGEAFAFLGAQDADMASAQEAPRFAARWGIVHGLAALAADGRLDTLRQQSGDDDLDALIGHALGLVSIA